MAAGRFPLSLHTESNMSFRSLLSCNYTGKVYWDGQYGSWIAVYILTYFYKHWRERTSNVCVLPLCFLRPFDISRATGRDTAFFKDVWNTHTYRPGVMFLVLSLKNVKWCISLCVFSRPELYARFTASPAMKWEQIYLGNHFSAMAEQVLTASSSCRVVSALWQKRGDFI